MSIQTQISKSFVEEMMDFVQSIYTKEAKKIAEKHKAEIAKELDDLMIEISTRAALSIRERVRVSDLGREVVISIEKR